MREAASRGFWMTTYAPYGYKRVYVQDGAKKRPTLELDPPADAVVRRIFDIVLQGKSTLNVTKDPQRRGRGQPQGKAVAQDHRPQRAAQRSLHGHAHNSLPCVHMKRPGGPYGVQCQRRGETRLARTPDRAGSPRQNAWIECPAKEAALVRIALEGMAQQVAVADRRGFKAGYQVVYVHST